FIIYITIFIIMGLSDAVIPIIPELVELSQAPYGPLSSSLLFSGYFLGALVTMLPFGLLADRYGNEKLITLGILLTLISGSIIMTSNNFWILFLARILEGTACGAFFPAAFSILSKFEERKKYFGEFNFLLNAGLGFGLLVAGILASIHIRAGIFIFTLMSGLVLIISIYRMTSIPVENALKDNAFMGLPFTLKGRISLIYYSLLNIRQGKIWIFTFLLFGCTAVLIAFYPDYSAEFLSKAELGGSLALIYFVAMATSFFAGRSSYDYRSLIYTGLFFTGIGAIISINYPIIGFSVLGAGSGIGMVGLPVAVSKMKVPRGLSMGLFNTATYGGLALLPIFAGFFISILSFEQIFLINGLLVIVAAIYARAVF
ncbi:MFS transporter, partial [Methanosalsum natronophilum]